MAGAGVTFGEQAAGGMDEIVERVGATVELAVEIPLIAPVVAAADMGDGIGIAAVEQAQAIGVEGRRHGDAVGAIGVKEEPAPAVALEAALVDDRDRDAPPVA